MVSKSRLKFIIMAVLLVALLIPVLPAAAARTIRVVYTLSSVAKISAPSPRATALVRPHWLRPMASAIPI